MKTLTIILAASLAKMLDPVAAALCIGSAAMIGSYRVAVPVGAGIYLVLTLAFGWSTWHYLVGACLAGSALSALGLFLWRLIPGKVKARFIDS